MKSRRGFWLRLVASCLLLAGCLAFVDPSSLFSVLDEVPLSYFLCALVLNALGTIVVKAWVAHQTVGTTGLNLSFLHLIRINLVARFYTLVLPRGASAAIRWHHYRRGGTGHDAAALLFFETIVSVATLFSSAAIILCFEQRNTGQIGTTLLPVALLGSFLSILALLPFLHEPSLRLADRVVRPLVKRGGRLANVIGRLMEAFRTYQKIEIRNVGIVLLSSFLGYIFFVLSALALTKGMNLDLGVFAIAWIRSLTLLLALIPITVAGLGLREGSLIVLFGSYGISPTHAFAFAMASFSIQIVLGLLGAGLELFRVARSFATTREGKRRD